MLKPPSKILNISPKLKMQNAKKKMKATQCRIPSHCAGRPCGQLSDIRIPAKCIQRNSKKFEKCTRPESRTKVSRRGQEQSAERFAITAK